MENSGIVQCITVAFSELYDSRPPIEDGLAYGQGDGLECRSFQRIIAKSFVFELEGEKKKCEELTAQMDSLAIERLNDKKALEQANAEILELKQEKHMQMKENHSIRKQLVEIRKELRLLVISSSLPHS